MKKILLTLLVLVVALASVSCEKEEIESSLIGLTTGDGVQTDSSFDGTTCHYVFTINASILSIKNVSEWGIYLAGNDDPFFPFDDVKAGKRSMEFTSTSASATSTCEYSVYALMDDGDFLYGKTKSITLKYGKNN